MADERFPLFRLPKEAAEHVTKVMDDSERIVISFCSKRTKALVTTQVRRGLNFLVFIGRAYIVSYFDFTIGEAWGHNTELDEESIRVDENIVPNSTIVPFTWRQPGWSRLDRINHIKSLFPRVVDVGTQFVPHLFDLNHDLPLFRSDSVRYLGIPTFVQDDFFNDQILSHFYKANTVRISCAQFRNPAIFGKVAIRNMDEIVVFMNFQICLDQLLLTNCRFLHLRDQTLTARVFNKFLKLWTKGSNPNLKYLQCYYSAGQEHNMDIRVVLAGINSFQLLGRLEIPFAVMFFYKAFIEDAFQIYDKNGRKGMLECNEAERYLRFVIFD